MEKIKNNSNSANEQNQAQEQEIDFVEIFYKLIAKWKWFVMALIIALGGAFIYLHWTTPIYQATASIVIKKDKGDQSNIADKLFDSNSTNFFARDNSEIDDEMEILSSRSIIMQVVNELRLHTSYYISKGFKTVEETTLPVVATLEDSAVVSLSKPMTIILEKTSSGYEAQATQGDITITKDFSNFPATISTTAGKVDLALTNNDFKWPGNITIHMIRPIDAVRQCTARLTVNTSSKKTNIISLSYSDINKRRAELFLSKLIEVYNRDAMEDKNKVTGNTLDFLNERLDSISQELGFVDRDMERYKTQQQVSDLKANMQLDLTSNSEYEQKLLDVETQLNMANYITNYLQKSGHRFSLVPINTGISNTDMAALINEYNKELLERERLLHMMREDNPTVETQNLKIDAMRKNVISSLVGVRNGLVIAKDDIMKKTNYFNNRISNLPKQEREYNNIDRQQQIKGNLYLMLLERREQTAISLAATINKARIIDAALAADSPIAPKRMMIYAGAGFLALLLTGCLVIFGDTFRTRLGNINEIEATQIPIVGMVPQISNPKKMEVVESRNSMIDESFRRMRSNLKFMSENGDKKCILVTSTMSGEGKSFTSINLALTLAFLGKKVALIGLDLRRPRVAEYFGIKSKLGMTNYLSGGDISLDEIIFPSGINPNLSVIPAGPIPPNPAEQLEKPILKTAFDELRTKFDYIVVDTAPVGLVSDTYSIAKITDLTLYICRMSYTPRKVLNMIKGLQENGQLNNISLAVNGVKIENNSYGYGYGKYGYGKYGYGKYGYGYGYGYGGYGNEYVDHDDDEQQGRSIFNLGKRHHHRNRH